MNYRFIDGECILDNGDKLSPAEIVLLSALSDSSDDREIILHARSIFDGELIVDEDWEFPFESYDEELDDIAKEFEF